MHGFIKYNRSEATKNLECRPNENHLLSIIARRVSRNGNPVKGVEKGEALVGDYEKMGLKRQPYRTALSNLIKWGYITTRVTNRTTYAKLVNIEVYDCNVIDGNQQDNPTLTTKLTNLQPIEQPTSNHNQEVKKKEREELKKKDIVDFLEVFNHFKQVTGKQVKAKSTASLIRRSDKYKKINGRLTDGATVEQCKSVIDAKYKEWKDNAKMKQYIRFETLFNKTKFESYLDELADENPTKQFPYDLPEFRDAEDRQSYFYARYDAYKPFLDERKKNTVYKKRALYEKDAEGLCFELELENPKLLEIDFKYVPFYE